MKQIGFEPRFPLTAISPYKNASEASAPKFQGYFAAPLDTLYLESEADKTTNIGLLAVARQLQAIGDEEGFKVGVQAGEKVYYDLDKVPDLELPSTSWGQDGKLILKTAAGEKVVSPAYYRSNHEEEQATIDPLQQLISMNNGSTASKQKPEGHAHGKDIVATFAKAIGLPMTRGRAEWEGGNVFLGNRPDGTPFALVGKGVLESTCRYVLAAEKKGIQIHAKEQMHEHPELAALNIKPYQAKARKLIAQDFNVKPKNLFFVSQPNFHIDMGIRPLTYPTVLVNDYSLSLQLLKKLQQEMKSKEANDRTGTSGQVQFGHLMTWQPHTALEFLGELIEETEQKQKSMETKYASADVICQELKSQGFEPIRVPGLFNASSTNFMNATVHQREDGGLVYITNKSPVPKLNEVFENYLLENVPSVKSVRFIDGITVSLSEEDNYCTYRRKPYPEDALPFRYVKNYMAKLLHMLEGGVHCKVTERMK